MSQCSALFYEGRSRIGWYCVLESGHRGDHKTDDGRAFTYRQATHLAYKPTRGMKQPPR